jgi:DNA-binding MarR family transcriptional regulator
VTLLLIPAIHRLTHQIALELEATPGLDLSQAEAHVLAHLVAKGNSTASDIHRAFGHKKSTLTAVLDRLEARHLIARRPSAHDRRAIEVSLTDEGTPVAHAAHARLLEIEGALFARLSPSERALMTKALDTSWMTSDVRPRGASRVSAGSGTKGGSGPGERAAAPPEGGTTGPPRPRPRRRRPARSR